MKDFKLNRQLRQAGASRQEVRDLTALTADLRNSIPHLDASVKHQIAQDIGIKQRPAYAKPRFAMAGAFAAIVILSIAAQFATPGSPLYALKKATQEVRVILQPSFKHELEQQRQDDERKSEEQQKIEDNRGSGSDGDSGRGSSSDDSSIEINGNSGSGSDSSGKVEDIEIDNSGSGSGSLEIKTPEIKIDNSGESSGGSGSGGSDDVKSIDVPKL